MKKFILVLLIMLVSFSVFAKDDNIVSHCDGIDWSEWSYDFKVGYMYGYLSANDGIYQWVYWTTDASKGDDDMSDWLEFMYTYPGETVDSLIAGVNSYYAKYPDYIEDRVHEVIMYNASKDWWNWDEEETSYTDDTVEEELEA